MDEQEENDQFVQNSSIDEDKLTFSIEDDQKKENDLNKYREVSVAKKLSDTSKTVSDPIYP